MLIIYEDEYGVVIHSGYIPTLATIGDAVVMDNEEFYVKSRVFYPQEDKVVLIVSESAARKMQAESVDNSRFNQLNAAIINTNKRIDTTDKKNRALSDRVSSVKKSVNRQIKQEKKDQ